MGAVYVDAASSQGAAGGGGGGDGHGCCELCAVPFNSASQRDQHFAGKKHQAAAAAAAAADLSAGGGCGIGGGGGVGPLHDAMRCCGRLFPPTFRAAGGSAALQSGRSSAQLQQPLQWVTQSAWLELSELRAVLAVGGTDPAALCVQLLRSAFPVGGAACRPSGNGSWWGRWIRLQAVGRAVLELVIAQWCF